MATPIIGFFTDYSKNLELNLWLKGGTMTAPVTLYLGLSYTPASRLGSLSNLTGAGYARVLTPTSSWSTAASGLITNSAIITFPTAGAGGWIMARSLFMADAASGGNVIWMANLAPDASGDGVTVAAGGVLSFDIGAISIRK